MKKTNKYSTRELLTGIWKASYGARLQVAICAFVGIISVACSLLFVYLSKEAIDIATGVSTGVLWHYGLGMGILILTEILLRATNTWLANTLSVKTQNRLRTGLFERLIKSEWEGKEARHQVMYSTDSYRTSTPSCQPLSAPFPYSSPQQYSLSHHSASFILWTVIWLSCLYSYCPSLPC